MKKKKTVEGPITGSIPEIKRIKRYRIGYNGAAEDRNGPFVFYQDVKHAIRDSQFMNRIAFMVAMSLGLFIGWIGALWLNS